MKGDDVKAWQNTVKNEFARMGIDAPIKADGVYGPSTRAYTASLLYALGIDEKAMEHGVTPELRVKVRNHILSPEEKKRKDSRVDWRRRLRERYADQSAPNVHRPTKRILQDSWGYHPPGHDGIDVITPPNPVIYAMIKSRVIDVRSSGWWGKSARPSGGHSTSEGDGIIQLEVLESIGPFIKGRHIGYGHAEKAKVKVGQIVDAGDPIGHAGFAIAWHIHLMYNTGKTTKGIGNINPRAILDYAVKHG